MTTLYSCVLSCFQILGLCPKGDDPLTPFSDYRAILITITQTPLSPNSGAYKFTFNGQSISLPIYLWDDKSCAAQFATLLNVASVKCTITRIGRYGGYSAAIQFRAFPVVPFESNIYANDGNPPITAFSCDNTGVDSYGHATCTITDIKSYELPGRH